jgi:very-short-patch-repair endonuclease
MFVCQYCNQEKKNHNSWRNHQRLCKENPDKQQSNFVHHSGIPWNKGLDKTDPRVAKNAENLSKSKKGKAPNIIWTDEMRKAKSEWRKQLHLNNPESHPNRRLAGNKKKMTYPEKIAADWLDRNHISYEHNKRISRYYPDFTIGNIIVEIDGEYWHNEEKDRIRDKKLNDLGYTVYRIKAKERIEEKLQELLGVG